MKTLLTGRKKAFKGDKRARPTQSLVRRIPQQTQTPLNTQKRSGATETAFKGGKRARPAQNAARRITLITNIAPPHTRGLHGTHPPFTDCNARTITAPSGAPFRRYK